MLFKFEFSIKYRYKIAAIITMKPDVIDTKDLEGIFDATSNSNENLKERILSDRKDDTRSDRLERKEGKG